MRKKHLPNLLTFCRIGLSFFLAFLKPQSPLFVLLYLLCGLTDVLDGYLARKLNAETELGGRLDSLADFFMCVMILFAILKQVPIDLPLGVGIGAIAVIRASNVLYSKVKFGRAASIHTLANKVTGLLFFFCPLACTLPESVFYTVQEYRLCWLQSKNF